MYDRSSYSRQPTGMGGGGEPPPQDIIVLLVVIFVTFSMQFFGTTAWISGLMRLTPAVWQFPPFVWQLVTYPFAGVGAPSFWFLLELLILFWFGRDVYRFLGRKHFWRMIGSATAAAGVAAVLVQLVLSLGSGASRQPTFEDGFVITERAPVTAPAMTVDLRNDRAEAGQALGDTKHQALTPQLPRQEVQHPGQLAVAGSPPFAIMQGQRMLLTILIAAFATLYGHATILLFFVLPVKARYFLGLEILFAFMAFLSTKDFAGFVGICVAVGLTYSMLSGRGPRRLLHEWKLRLQRIFLQARLKQAQRKRGFRVVKGGRDDPERGPWVN